ncbi:hypothetical protein MKX01_031653 [Papaver californicum]|nr:hypothetical protein MKX01_031653 [Papaver californicum]
MGNYKFRLSDMMPNAWFYKLKNGAAKHHPHPPVNKNKHKNSHHHHYLITPPPPPPPYHQQTQQISHPRHSYYFTREPYIKPETNNQVLLDIHKAIQSSSPTNPKVSVDLHSIAAAEQPRKSSKRSKPKKSRRRTVNNKSASPVSSSCNCRDTRESSSSICSTASKSVSTPDYSAASPECAESVRVDTNSVPMSMSSSSTTSCSCRVSASTTDIIIDIIDSKKSSSAEKFDDGFDPITELELPPIITKLPKKFSQNKNTKEQKSSGRRNSTSINAEEKNVHGSLSSKEQKSSPFVRKSISAGSPGLKLRSNSPRILTRKAHSKNMTMTFLGGKPRTTTTTTTGTKKPTTAKLIPVVSSIKTSVSDSFAIIKSSFDPQRDFRESMVEMIVENNLRKSGDLEELLACYLLLNSNEYHDIIVEVFQQIWFDLTDIH